MSEQRLNYIKLAPEGIAAMRALEHYLNSATGLEASLLEMVRLRASLRNGCEYCIGKHTYELKKTHHEPEGRVDSVAEWRGSSAYTQRERAALAWTEAVTDVHGGHVSDAVYAEARAHFEEKELVDLTLVIASINAWNRLGIAFRAEWKEPGAAEADGADRSAIKDDGGKVAVDEEAG
jgi:AhpD family alkylhydroperoxidase